MEQEKEEERFDSFAPNKQFELYTFLDFLVILTWV